MPQNEAKIGHNRSPFDLIAERIGDLYEEAKLWLDGEAIETQGQADSLEALTNEIKAAIKEADELRKEEVKPLDDAKRAVQERFAPLIADNKTDKGKAVLALDACKNVLTPWKQRLLREKEEAARIAREEADAKQREAEAKLRAAAMDNLAEREAAEALVREAKEADKAAKKAEKTGPTGLRTSYRAEIVNAAEFARFMWTEHYLEMLEFLQQHAQRMVNAKRRSIPGINVVEEKRAA